MIERNIKILGICGSHRKEMNSWYALKRCLEGIQTLGIPVETEIITLQEKKIGDCKGCHLCFTKAKKGAVCPAVHDDMDEIYPKVMEADGIIVASPVHWWSSSSVLRRFIDRMNAFCGSGNTEFARALYNKVGGVLTVSYDVHGGTEVAATHILTWMLAVNMITVGTQAAHVGGTAATNLGVPTAGKDSVKYDHHGMKTIYEMGRRVAETAWMIKCGRANMGEIQADIQGIDGIEIDWDKFYEYENSFPKEHLTVEGKLATSRVAFERFLDTMSSRKKTDGKTWGVISDVEEFKKMWLEDKGLQLLSDAELYSLCPEYYDFFLKKR